MPQLCSTSHGAGLLIHRRVIEAITAWAGLGVAGEEAAAVVSIGHFVPLGSQFIAAR